MPYSVRISAPAQRQIRKLPPDVQRRIAPAIDALAADPYPRGARKLGGRPGEYRVRVGEYRIIYEVRERELVVLVLEVGPRKDVYR